MCEANKPALTLWQLMRTPRPRSVSDSLSFPDKNREWTWIDFFVTSKCIQEWAKWQLTDSILFLIFCQFYKTLDSSAQQLLLQTVKFIHDKAFSCFKTIWKWLLNWQPSINKYVNIVQSADTPKLMYHKIPFNPFLHIYAFLCVRDQCRSRSAGTSVPSDLDLHWSHFGQK
jgi:hypothetical protein